MKLFEVVKTKTKTKSQIVDIPWDDEPSLPAAPPKPDRPVQGSNEQPLKRRSMGPTADASRTAEKTSGIALSPDASERLKGFLTNHPDDGTDDEVGTDLEQRITNDEVPAVMNDALAIAGDIAPEWHMVANLPGNMKQAIRRLGKAIFDQYTSTPTDKIQMIGNLGGQGPNDPKEINAVAQWVNKHGEPVTDGEIDFSNIMPGYKANMKVYNVEGVQVMLVQDEYGQYIYAWPQDQSKIGQQASSQRLLPR